jgi:hypothetical protein
MYASIFSYRPSRERYELLGFRLQDQEQILQTNINIGKIPSESLTLLHEFMASSETE